MKKNNDKLKLPSILDKEISKIEDDKFGHIHYAQILFSLIENHKPPFSIGLLGEWGVGKSSIKELCKKEFLDKHKDKYEILDFNAWRYESEDVRRSLLKYLYKHLSGEKEEKTLKQRLYSQISDIFKREKTPGEYIVEFIDKYLWIPGQILCIFLILIALAIWITEVFSFNSVNAVIVYTMFSICGTAIIKYAFNVNGFIVSKYTDRVVMTPPIINASQFEEEILKLLKKDCQCSKKKKIVIFIDDLDRLTAEKMINGLDAIRVFLDLPISNFIFVVSCYDEYITNSIIKTKTTFSNIDSARKYLDRVFQFKIDIPALPNQSMKQFAEEHLKKLVCYSEFLEDVNKTNNYGINKILNILVPIEISSPRATVQILNSYMQAWWLAKQREKRCEKCNETQELSCPSKKECLLIKNIITNRLDILAIITVLKNQFPDFYNDLVIDPQLLKTVMWKFLKLKSNGIILNSQRQLLLEKYSVQNKDENSAQKEKNIYVFKSEYVNLQSYLSSIQTINIPDNIKPFIMLLQDPLERKIDGDTVPLYNALITQNWLRLRDEMGINNDNTKLSEIQTSQLYNILEEINRNEDPDRIEKAYITLAMLANQYGGKDAKYLIEEVSKTILERKYIDKIDISNIQSLLKSEYIKNERINKIYAYLTETLTGEKITSLTKVLSEDYFKTVLSIGLELHYAKNQLDNNNQNDLMQLLNTGTFTYTPTDNTDAAGYDTIKVDFYIDSIEKYGNALLKDLGFKYIEDLLEHLNNSKDEDIDKFISQIDFVFQNVAYEKENCKIVASVINKGIANNKQKIINYFISLILEKNIFNNIETNFIPEIIDSYVQRIIKHYSANKLDDIQKYIKNLLTIITKYEEMSAGKIDNSISLNLSNLIEIIAKKEVPDIFEQLFDKYNSLFDKDAASILDKLSDKIFLINDIEETDLISEQLLKLLAKKYIGDLQIKHIKDTLQELFEDYSISIDDVNANRYYILISNLNEVAIHSESFKNHISNVYENLELSLSKQYNDYFDTLVDTVIPLFDKIKTETLDSLLSYIIENYLTSETEETEKFYSLMKNNWPHEDGKRLSSYSPIKIMQAAEGLIEKAFDENDTTFEYVKIYNSIYSIYTNNVVPQDIVSKKILVHCLYKIWKFDIEFAYNNFLLFIDIVRNNYLYEVLCLRNATRNPKLLENIWQKCINEDSNENLILKTKKFLTDKLYYNSSFKILWLNLIKQKDSNIQILAKAIEAITNDEELDTFISSKDNLVKIFLKEFTDTEINVIAKSLLILHSKTNNGIKNRKRSLSLFLRDLIGINGSNILNANTLKNYSLKDIITLSKVFTGNIALTRLINKLAKNKKIKGKIK
ncbi:MAG: P-loop NTPase fold protein [Candidatus Gastranaerophilales bacterium]|nr:P-loop NTPase fold protein [Candidatus Gastranaerophilales bacterium]